MKKLYEFFLKYDCSLLEINPIAETSDGVGNCYHCYYARNYFNCLLVMAMDAKLNFDDNASYRQPEIFALRDRSQEDSREVTLNHTSFTSSFLTFLYRFKPLSLTLTTLV